MADINIQPLDFIRNLLDADDSDPVREMLALFAQVLMHHEANAACGAGYRSRSDERVNQRNGFRSRRWDTRAGTVQLNVPKLRQGSYFPQCLLEPRRRAERALHQVIVEAYVKGVSTRRVDDLVKSMGIDGIGKSQVSAPGRDRSHPHFRRRGSRAQRGHRQRKIAAHLAGATAEFIELLSPPAPPNAQTPRSPAHATRTRVAQTHLAIPPHGSPASIIRVARDQPRAATPAAGTPARRTRRRAPSRPRGSTPARR